MSKTTANSTFAIGGISYFADSFVVKGSPFSVSTFVLKNPPNANLPTVTEVVKRD